MAAFPLGSSSSLLLSPPLFSPLAIPLPSPLKKKDSFFSHSLTVLRRISNSPAEKRRHNFGDQNRILPNLNWNQLTESKNNPIVKLKKSIQFLSQNSPNQTKASGNLAIKKCLKRGLDRRWKLPSLSMVGAVPRLWVSRYPP